MMAVQCPRCGDWLAARHTPCRCTRDDLRAENVQLRAERDQLAAQLDILEQHSALAEHRLLELGVQLGRQAQRIVELEAAFELMQPVVTAALAYTTVADAVAHSQGEDWGLRQMQGEVIEALHGAVAVYRDRQALNEKE